MKQFKKRFLAGALAFVMTFGALAAFGVQLAAQEPTVPLYSVEDIFTLPEAMGFSLSPDGQSLYFAAPVNGIINVFRRDIATGEEVQVTFEAEQHVFNLMFKGDTMLFMRDAFGDENPNIFRVNEDGTSTNLTPFSGVMAMPLDLLEATDVEDEILIAMNRENPQMFNIYRLNIVTGELTMVMQAVDGAITDRTGTIRMIIVALDGVNMSILHRYSDDDEFELAGIVTFNDHISEIQFDANNEYIYVVSNVDRERTALMRANPATMEVVDVIFEHPQVDILGTFGSMFTAGTPGGVVYHVDFQHRHFLTQEAEDFFTEVYALLPQNSMASITGMSDDFSMATIHVRSDVNRGRVYLFDRAAGTIELLADTNFAPPEHMAQMMPISYTARDGVEIPGYLTLPVGVDPVNLPVVMIPHGGPHARDYWGGFFDWVQFLANRGYAVFQPNFRGSSGYGRTFMEAGFREWGLLMQDDKTDGILWLIEEGIADPDRIAIFGASYGGYAALAGAAFTPELYAAAVSLVGVSNIFTWIESIPPMWEPMRDLLHERVGHPVHDYDRLRATSPVFHVEHITAPMFIAHGANDVRVTLYETTQIVEALQALGVDVEYMIFWDEGHGMVFEHNNFAFFTMLEAFLAEHLGGRTLTTMEDLRDPVSYEELGGNIVEFIPLNINGNQGQILFSSDVNDATGEFAAVFHGFTHGMTSVNVAITIGDRVAAFGMDLQPGDALVFMLFEEDMGHTIDVRVSTNCTNSGTMEVSLALVE
ncbi:MAG: prolyl oligopeptidase family serine peptidase [Defluviitaleaceae bacterium]|nr:prolyl oligopeptidase family serine peptidase [Defluviitaleaceae bacterium]